MTAAQVKNIVISGTNMWNPGDDFVRDGVIRILRELFAGFQLNFLFYNFNQDFFPQSKFAGITNMASKGDLDRYSDFIDAVVIAGLSAGNEIKDLYTWIIKNKLHDRVYLIGAGYENSYVERYISEEPEATIFKNARIITGRTRKTPQFIPRLNLPYHHINCPALLSVPSVKQVSPGKRISRIGLSIQLPHGYGIPNHCCSKEIYNLGVNILLSLKSKYELELVAHHKSEYFHFINLLKGQDIPVIFSSFYHDLFDIYPRYDLVVTTRLHSSLFANGFGIPGIIINDTDRHTHCLEGFPHSVWVSSVDSFVKEFERVSRADLQKMAIEADSFKKSLLNKYLDILREPFGIPSSTRLLSSSKPDPTLLLSSIGSSEVKQRVLENLSHLSPDIYLTRNIEDFRTAIQKGGTWFDSLVFLNWYATIFKPATYLEIGVRRGRSMAQVVVTSPETRCYGFDMWIPNYSGVDNPGREFVLNELKKLHARKLPTLIEGNSHETLPVFWANPTNPQLFDLIFVDGDHSYQGAKKDLDIAFQHLAPGGALLFDDISHSSHPELYPLWNEYKHKFPDCLFIEDRSGNGTACAFKPPFTHLEKFTKRPVSSLNLPSPPSLSGNIQNPAIKSSNFPIHFFTIVLNGEPFIRHHIEVFRELPFKWHWHIIEGVAELKHDTGWSLQFGGKITDDLHRGGLSNDGTTEYLDVLKNKFPDNITIYRKQKDVFWDGKLEMVNAPVDKIHEECLLWQIDVDELWTRDQLIAARQMFENNPTKSAAYYYCFYFVGEHLVITTRNTYGNNTSYEWLRTWRFKPGMRWMSHEPPRLCIRLPEGKWQDVAKVAPINHSETEARKLVFQHYAYATEKQLRFKESYFGYREALKQWEILQTNLRFPVFLRDFFSWVKDDARVDTIRSLDLTPIAQKNDKGKWIFIGTEHKPREEKTLPYSPDSDPHDVTASTSSSNTKNILWVRTDSIGDNILSASMLPSIRRKYKGARITVVCQNHSYEFYAACPFVDDIIAFDRQRALQDGEYRSSIVQQLQVLNADLVLNSVYSRELLTDLISIAGGVKEKIAFNGDLCNITEEFRDKHNQFYTRLLPSNDEHKPELERHRDFLIGLGIDVPFLQPTIWTTSEDERFAQKIFSDNNINPENTIALFPMARHQHKVYQHYQSVLRHFQDFDLVVLGGKDALVAADKICEKFHGNCVNLTGKTTICQMASVIRRCRVYLGSDSAGAHVAAAVGVPNVVIQGGGHFSRFLPYSPLTSVVCLPLECYSCNWQCTYQKVHCINDILPDVIIEAMRQTLKQSSEAPRVFVQTDSLCNPPEEHPKWKALRQSLRPANAEIIPVGAESYPTDISVLSTKGEGLFAKGDLEGALEAFTKALEINPNYVPTHQNLGVLYWQTGEAQKAIEHFTYALEIDPNNRDTIFNCGELFKSLNKFEDAGNIYASYLRKNPNDEEIGRALAELQNRRGIEMSEADEKYLVSAIVSTFNSELFIRGRLQNLVDQTLYKKNQLEIIVIDSNSPQNEREVVEEFMAKYKDIRYLRTMERETVFGAWNRGIRLSRGKYITNANTDDRLARHALERMAAALEARPDIALVYANSLITKTINETFENCTPIGSCRWKDFDPVALLDECYIGPQPMWRKSVHIRYGYFDENFVSAGDWEFWLRMAAEEKFLHIDEFLGLYLMSTDSLEHRDKELSLREAERVRRLYASRRHEMIPEDPDSKDRICRDAEEMAEKGLIAESKEAFLGLLEADPDYVPAHNNLAYLYWQDGDVERAMESVNRAMALAPDDRDVLWNAGQMLSALGQEEEARGLFRRYVQEHPEEEEFKRLLASGKADSLS